jgi:acyl-CoA synthetase (AMP-forming)/AMP-acid ligase II
VTSSLAEVFLHHVTQQPSAPFLTDPATATSLTYSETAQRAAGLTHSLRRAGVQPGDRIAQLIENTWHWPVAFLAAGLAGAIVVPFNTRWSATEVRHALRDCAPAVVIHDDASAGVMDASAHAMGAARVLRTDDFPGGGPEAAALPEPGSIGAITYTSGTSGLAKGVMLTHSAMLGASLTYAALFNSTPRLRTAVVVPLFHNTGFIDGLGHALVAGGHLDVHRRFDARLIAARLGAGEYSFLIGVPTMYTRMLPHLQPSHGTSGAGPWLAYGGAAMPPATVRRLHELIPGARLVNCYGLSEATSITHYLPHDLAADRPDAVGIAAPGTLDRISDSGELEVSSPTVMAGYWNDPAATAARLDGGWLRTGDCARRSADGLITITGRTSDLINRGGEKIAPYEVESALCDISGIIEAVVVGLPHHDLGEIPVALVVCEAGTTVTQPEVSRRLRDRLADYKIPEQVLAVPALPRNASGKVVRMEALKLARRLG